MRKKVILFFIVAMLAPLSRIEGQELTLQKWKEHTNSKLGVSFSYPEGFTIQEGDIATHTGFIPWIMPLAMRIAFPDIILKQGLTDAAVSLATYSRGTKGWDYCMDSILWETKKKSAILDEVVFKKSTISDAAMGHTISGMNYVKIQGDECLLLMSITQWSRYERGNEPETENTETVNKIDGPAIRKTLDQIISSIKFDQNSRWKAR